MACSYLCLPVNTDRLQIDLAECCLLGERASPCKSLSHPFILYSGVLVILHCVHNPSVVEMCPWRPVCRIKLFLKKGYFCRCKYSTVLNTERSAEQESEFQRHNGRCWHNNTDITASHIRNGRINHVDISSIFSVLFSCHFIRSTWGKWNNFPSPKSFRFNEVVILKLNCTPLHTFVAYTRYPDLPCQLNI